MNTTPRGTNGQWKRRLLAAAVVGPALGLFASAAQAQYQVNRSGARDANNRVGSGGRNDTSAPRIGTTVNPNLIVYGNVTGAKYFRGPVGSTDPRAFRGETATETSDAFIRDSASGYDRTSGAASYNPQPFFGDSRGVAPPVGYIPPTTTTGGYGNNYALYSSRISPQSYAGLNGATSDGLVLPRVGTSITAINGPADTGGTVDRYVTMSPLAGIGEVPSGELGSYYIVRGSERIAVDAAGRPISRSDVNSALVQQMRDELSGNRGPQPVLPGGAAPNGTYNGAAGNAPGGNRPQGGATPIDPFASPTGTPPAGTPPTGLQSAVPGAPVPGATPTPGIRRQIVNPAEQSAQYRELQRRFREAYGDGPITDQQAQQQYRETKRVLDKVAAGAPGGTTRPTTPGGVRPGVPGGAAMPGLPPVTPGPGTPGAAPAVPVQPPARPGRKPEPYVVKSLAEGVTSPTLAKVLTDAEAQMRDGKFAAALDLYAKAEVGAPNNALITLGKANANLGAFRHRSAEMDIRRAFTADQTLLAGKYDLRSFLPAERLTQLTKDLKDLAAREPKETMAPFLLAYVTYNSGAEGETLGYLNEVEKRAGGEDAIVTLMRQAWTLPGAPDQNK